ncbi:MAG: pyruvate carboxyltransferase [Thermodesulfobacteriota bacterium]|nr:pyruvate carboxyltransferase [Thermodesulfobacteriota bacterium]
MYDKFKLNYPKKVRIGDISVREGLQHEEHFIPIDAKVYYVEEAILAGFTRLEISNLANPAFLPQFRDVEELFKRVRDSRRLSRRGINFDDIELTAVAIRETGVDRAVAAKKEGWGPDRIGMMVSTDEEHHFANSGTTLPEYWEEARRCIEKCHDVGIRVFGTVSTIWGSPISGPTRFEDALDFTKHWLNIGADDIEHADHDGSAPPDQVYRYFSMIIDELPNTDLHIAHFHVTRGWGLANVLAALQAGVDIHEGVLGGIGGQPTNFIDRTPVRGTGEYYYKDPNIVGLTSLEDMLVMMDEMSIDTGIDVDRVLALGKNWEKTIGRRLRSESILNGRIPKKPRPEYKRKGLAEKKAKRGEEPWQIFPREWSETVDLDPEITGKR